MVLLGKPFFLVKAALYPVTLEVLEEEWDALHSPLTVLIID